MCLFRRSLHALRSARYSQTDVRDKGNYTLEGGGGLEFPTSAQVTSHRSAISCAGWVTASYNPIQN
jgi:hypothetical protein